MYKCFVFLICAIFFGDKLVLCLSNAREMYNIKRDAVWKPSANDINENTSKKDGSNETEPLKLQARGFMEVWNGHATLLHRFIKANRIAVRSIANGDNRGSPRPTKIPVKKFQIYAGLMK